MKQFFNVDNIIFRGISKWMDYVYVSVLWFVCSIPLITMGAAASALYHTSGQCLRHDRGYIFRSFWGCFKNSFRQSAAAVVILGVYVFPYISRYRSGLSRMVKNCICLSILNVPWTLLLIIILISAICLVYILPGSVLIIPSCAGVFFNLILERIFDKYMDNGGTKE